MLSLPFPDGKTTTSISLSFLHTSIPEILFQESRQSNLLFQSQQKILAMLGVSNAM
jgi:hypothetical protein